MKALLHNAVSDKSGMTRELATTLRSTLDQKYSRVLRSAQAQWEQRFAGKEPSDACVSVRIAPRSTGTRGNPSWQAA